MQALDRIDWEILNATADDCENLEEIFLSLAFDLSPLGFEGNGHAVYRRTKEPILLFEVANRVRRLFPKLPVVIASGYGRSGVQGGLQFISKPYSAVDLQQALESP